MVNNRSRILLLLALASCSINVLAVIRGQGYSRYGRHRRLQMDDGGMDAGMGPMTEEPTTSPAPTVAMGMGDMATDPPTLAPTTIAVQTPSPTEEPEEDQEVDSENTEAPTVAPTEASTEATTVAVTTVAPTAAATVAETTATSTDAPTAAVSTAVKGTDAPSAVNETGAPSTSAPAPPTTEPTEAETVPTAADESISTMPPDSNSQPDCPDTTGMCVAIDEPVECGWNKCRYDNMCWASSANFKTDECTRITASGGIISSNHQCVAGALAVTAGLILGNL